MAQFRAVVVGVSPSSAVTRYTDRDGGFAHVPPAVEVLACDAIPRTQDTTTIGTAASSGTTDPLPKLQTGVTRSI